MSVFITAPLHDQDNPVSVIMLSLSPHIPTVSHSIVLVNLLICTALSVLHQHLCSLLLSVIQSFLYVCVCVHVCAHTCMCMCVCVCVCARVLDVVNSTLLC